MAAIINTNIASLNAQRNLTSSQASLQTSLQRLSSGLRVNSAKDDAAGLAIATRMDSQIRGMNVAMRNSNDAISFSQTAEGALGKVTDALQRMRELAVQSANATNSTTDRENLNTEFKELQAELNRITDKTTFNDQKVFQGGSQTYQVGSSGTDTIDVNSTNLRALGSEAVAAQDAVAAQAEVAEELDPDTGEVVVAYQAAVAGQDAVAAQDAVVGSKIALAFNTDTEAGAVIDVLNPENSRSALESIDAALAEANTERAKYGAVQNRFESVVSNLQVSVENLSAAKSRILDADFAAETANLTRGQILQQAGTAMLAQANSIPNGVLSLLRG